MESTKKLALISEVMADGYMFVQLRFLLEAHEDDTSPAFEKLRDAIDSMYKVCNAVKGGQFKC